MATWDFLRHNVAPFMPLCEEARDALTRFVTPCDVRVDLDLAGYNSRRTKFIDIINASTRSDLGMLDGMPSWEVMQKLMTIKVKWVQDIMWNPLVTHRQNRSKYVN